MTDTTDHPMANRWEHLLEDIDLEIVQCAIMCKVRLLDPGVAERVLEEDPAVWDTSRAASFQKLRAMLVMHFTTRQQMADSIGAEESRAIAERVREQLRGRVGDQLGGDLTRPG
jgi:hypothetical protein